METEIQAVIKEYSSEVHPQDYFQSVFYRDGLYLSEQKSENFET